MRRIYLFACKECATTKAHPVALSKEELESAPCDSLHCLKKLTSWAEIKIRLVDNEGGAEFYEGDN